MPNNLQTIVIGGGCFWCLEAIYQRVKGVEKVVSGYSGGDNENPNYYNHGNHAEVIQVTFDPEIISLKTILEVFWNMHDPTTLNQPGTGDIGENYRSIILYKPEQKKTVEESLESIGKPLWGEAIITETKELEEFYPAEDYHQNFYDSNPNVGYCQVIINPKLEKFQQKFEKLLK